MVQGISLLKQIRMPAGLQMSQEPGWVEPLEKVRVSCFGQVTHHKLFLLVVDLEATQKFLGSRQPKLLLCSVALIHRSSALTLTGFCSNAAPFRGAIVTQEARERAV